MTARSSDAREVKFGHILSARKHIYSRRATTLSRERERERAGLGCNSVRFEEYILEDCAEDDVGDSAESLSLKIFGPFGRARLPTGS